MKKRLSALLAALLLLTSCAPAVPFRDDTVHILCTTYPVYLLTTALTGETEGVQVDLLVNAQTSCLHDYTLTVKDMRSIDEADVIVINGAGLEDFMDHALSQSHAAVIDAAQGIALLPTLEHAGHDGHDHQEEYDPHIWMDPSLAAAMLENIALGLDQALCGADSPSAFQTSCRAAQEALQQAQETWAAALGGRTLSGLVTFHDGFQYFARAFDLQLLHAIEEEEGSTASAREIVEMTRLVRDRDLPAIFTEVNGAQATAQAIGRETGCAVCTLDMLMSGDGVGIEGYIAAMDANLTTLITALDREEAAP